MPKNLAHSDTIGVPKTKPQPARVLLASLSRQMRRRTPLGMIERALGKRPSRTLADIDPEVLALRVALEIEKALYETRGEVP